MHLRVLVTAAVVAALTSLSSAAVADSTHDCVVASDDGQRLRDEGKLQAAHAAFVRCAAETCPPIVQRDCVQWLAEVDARQPTVILSVRASDGRDLLDVRVSVDGALLTTRVDGRAIPIDPGPHTFRFERPAAPVVEQSIVARERESGRVLYATLDVPSEPLTSAPPAPVQERSAKVPLSTYLLAGVGSTALVGFAYFGLHGSAAQADLADTCAPAGRCSEDSVARVRNELIVADVSLGIAIVALGLAGYFFFESRSR
jgi:hypothetical protein